MADIQMYMKNTKQIIKNLRSKPQTFWSSITFHLKLIFWISKTHYLKKNQNSNKPLEKSQTQKYIINIPNNYSSPLFVCVCLGWDHTLKSPLWSSSAKISSKSSLEVLGNDLKRGSMTWWSKSQQQFNDVYIKC